MVTSVFLEKGLDKVDLKDSLESLYLFLQFCYWKMNNEGSEVIKIVCILAFPWVYIYI